MTRRLQPGIAYESGRRPSLYYRLLLLDAPPEAKRREVYECLRAIHEMLIDLAAGDVAELRGQPVDKAEASAAQFAGLEHLLAFGRRLFDADVHGGQLTDDLRPDFLTYLPSDGPFPGLQWEASPADWRNRGEADIAIQLTAPNQAAVNCAAVEVWKLLESRDRPLRTVASFDGFGRLDGRGWLEFHDGVSNLRSSQRAAALEASADPAWMAGGTYMAYLRITIDLKKWCGLTRTEQELLVGRDKLTAGALVATHVDSSGQLLPVAAPLPGDDADDRTMSDFIEPPQTTDPVIEASHIHRANQLRGSPDAPNALRIFRQGYEFLEDFNGTPRLGLNFVSFQRDLSLIHHVLHLQGWLGDVNFGGGSSAQGVPPPTQFLAVAAGGLYAAPPSAAPFPGADVFAIDGEGQQG